MIETIPISQLNLTGRLTERDPNLPKLFVSYNANFKIKNAMTMDFTTINQNGVFGVPRSLFIDNGSNPSEVEISVTGTDQFFTVPPFAQGVFKIDAQDQSKITFATDGGSSDIVTITIYNWEVAPSVWYRFGAFNKDVALKVQGTNEAGADMNTAPDNNPVYLGGASDVDNSLVPISVDASGRLKVIGSAAGGNIFGTDATGTQPTQAPVYVAGLGENGNISPVNIDSDGAVLVSASLKNKAQSSGLTIVNVSNVSSLLLASNNTRLGGSVYNNSTEILYLLLSAGSASPVNFSVKLQADDYFEIPSNYVGEINGIWSGPASGAAMITEYF